MTPPRPSQPPQPSHPSQPSRPSPGRTPSSPRLSPARTLARVRTLCNALPEVSERPSHGAPTFFVGKKTFVMFHDDHHGDGRLALWCAAGPGDQDLLVHSDPESFFVPAYVGHRGWIGVRLDRALAWDAVAEVVEEAYRAVAPRRLVDRLDDASS